MTELEKILIENQSQGYLELIKAVNKLLDLIDSKEIDAGLSRASLPKNIFSQRKREDRIVPYPA